MNKFKQWLIINGYSESTVKLYTSAIDKITNEKISFTSEALSAFLLDIRKDKSISLFNYYLKALYAYRTFTKLDFDLPKYGKRTRKLPEYMTLEEFESEIIPTLELTSEQSFKFKVIFYFMYFTGLRISEIIALRREYFDLEKCTVKVYIKKGDEERIVFYTDKVKELLIKYFSIEPEEYNAFNVKDYTIRYLCYKLNKYLPSGIHLHPHLFRHSYAIHLLMNGLDLSAVSKLLGHRSISSTMRYIELKVDELKKKYDEHIK